MSHLLREYILLLFQESKYAGSHPEDGYEPADKDNLELNEPGTIVEPDVRKQVGSYLSKMGMMRGKTPAHPKGPKKRTRLA